MNHHYILQFYLRPWLGPDNKLQEFQRGYVRCGRKVSAMCSAAKALAEGKRARDDLKSIQNAADAMARNQSRPVDERLRDARKRGLYRVRTKSPHD